MEECLKERVLVDVLTRSRTEVLEVLLTEYNEEETREYLRREAIEEGLEEGLKKGLEEGREEGLKEGLKAMIELCQELNLSKEDAAARIAQKYRMEKTEIQKYMEMYWTEKKAE